MPPRERHRRARVTAHPRTREGAGGGGVIRGEGGAGRGVADLRRDGASSRIICVLLCRINDGMNFCRDEILKCNRMRIRARPPPSAPRGGGGRGGGVRSGEVELRPSA